MIVQKIVVRTDLNMRKGKLAAQVAHAANEPVIELYNLLGAMYLHQSSNFGGTPPAEERFLARRAVIEEWWNTGHTKIVLGIPSEEELRALVQEAERRGIPAYPVTDLGLTEFHGVPTLTCCGFGPWRKERLDEITRDLKLI